MNTRRFPSLVTDSVCDDGAAGLLYGDLSDRADAIRSDPEAMRQSILHKALI